MAGRYLATELQDDNGDVIYPHTEADIVFTSDGTTVEENLSGDFTDAEIQEIFSDNDSQLEAGKKLSVKEKIKRALKKYQALLRMRILDTVEEVEANTDDGYLMGAKAGAALINDLGGFKPIIDSATGEITGYKTQVGADTVFPFSSVNKITVVLRRWATWAYDGRLLYDTRATITYTKQSNKWVSSTSGFNDQSFLVGSAAANMNIFIHLSLLSINVE